MLRAYSDLRSRCQLHPHRLAEVKCERCKAGLCAECTHTYQGQKLCENCMNELEFIELSKPTLADRVRDFFTSLRNTLIVVLVLGGLMGGLFYLLKDTFNQPITPEQMARFRYAAGGSFQTPEGTNVNSTVLGAQVVSFTGQREGFEASHLINEYVAPTYPGWRSAGGTFPQDIVVSHENASMVSKVILTQQPSEPQDSWVKEFEIDVSTEGPTSGWQTVGTWTATQTEEPQKFLFTAAPSKWIRLRILSNYGNASYTSLGEFDAYIVTQSPFTPSSEATASAEASQ